MISFNSVTKGIVFATVISKKQIFERSLLLFKALIFLFAPFAPCLLKAMGQKLWAEQSSYVASE